MAKSKNSLLGLAALGAAVYLFRNKASRDKVMNQVQSMVTPEMRDKIMNQVRSFTGNNTNTSTNSEKPSDQLSPEPNSQALTTAETINSQTEEKLGSQDKKEITEVKVSN
ncbi:hypothetical protein [Peribacillus glennii]|uniref:Uncharacterized protein n=1 Tax=Peribacillus glennii TaxID=2303991 RepID=A0A372LG42_9BACI|nr:hypothetical protein [Peribacillus glennii]RFU65275.1 hypothetical protein D0466_05070 [Peribacillus glennii]